MDHESVVFDNSRVLVGSEALGNRLPAAMPTDEVAPTTFAEAVEHYLGKSFADMAETVRRRTGTTVPDDFGRRFHARLFDAFARELAAVDGVHELLDDLDARGIPYCVVSNDTAERVVVSLGLTGLAPGCKAGSSAPTRSTAPSPPPTSSSTRHGASAWTPGHVGSSRTAHGESLP
nr:hypothetical protein [Streptomyces sp. SID12501]